MNSDCGYPIVHGRITKIFGLGVSGSADGTGIGLAIVREIAAAHGWRVDATKSESGGAAFSVTGVEAT